MICDVYSVLKRVRNVNENTYDFVSKDHGSIFTCLVDNVNSVIHTSIVVSDGVVCMIRHYDNTLVIKQYDILSNTLTDIEEFQYDTFHRKSTKCSHVTFEKIQYLNYFSTIMNECLFGEKI